MEQAKNLEKMILGDGEAGAEAEENIGILLVRTKMATP
jgi:hypothetical protein